MELNMEWSEYASLTIYEGAFMLAVRADPAAHAYRYELDVEYCDYFDTRDDTHELIYDKCKVLSRAIVADDIIVVKEKHCASNGSIDFHKTMITRSSFIEWCKAYRYPEIVLAFVNAGKTSNAGRDCRTSPATDAESQDWRVHARKFADEFFDIDTKNDCRDSLRGYSRRVMEKMQKEMIHGPRGRIDNPNTIQREALQADEWWAGKSK